jgi:hypothetical protein
LLYKAMTMQLLIWWGIVLLVFELIIGLLTNPSSATFMLIYVTIILDFIILNIFLWALLATYNDRTLLITSITIWRCFPMTCSSTPFSHSSSSFNMISILMPVYIISGCTKTMRVSAFKRGVIGEALRFEIKVWSKLI